MNRIYYFTIILLLSVNCAFAQQTEVKHDSVKSGFQLLPEQQQPKFMDNNGYILPDKNLLPTSSKRRSLQQQHIMTFRVSIPEFIDTPWPAPRLGTSTNPFANDYNRSDAFLINYNSNLSTYSSYDTYPTMGTHINAGAIYTYTPNERWELSGGIFSSKYTMPSFRHGSKVDFGFTGSAAYRINDFMRIRAFGEYSVNGERNSAQGYMTPMYPQSGYGVIMEIRINEYVEIHGGMERSYNPMKRKWETTPIIYPVINLKKKKK